ncbi:MAG: hypothetical protein JO111_00880 [Caulobacteraceae bacterium]|nr:hypothetical protein [Caulobacteraceae bacterium]
MIDAWAFGRLVSIRFLWCLILLASTAAPPAQALDPSLRVTQYGHTAWKLSEGFPGGVVTAIAQTPDGWLWLGGDGLRRFDGVTITPWRPPAGQTLPDLPVRLLFVAHDGALWIAWARGLARWDGSRLELQQDFAGRTINAIAQAQDGTLWVGGTQPGFLCAIRESHTRCEHDGARLGMDVGTVIAARDGALWVATLQGVWRWAPGPPTRIMLTKHAAAALPVLTETPDGAVLFLTQDAVWRVDRGRAERTYTFAPTDTPNRILSDRDGALWFATASGGVLREFGGKIVGFRMADGLSADRIIRLFEDREGNIWISTIGGLDRFRAPAGAVWSRSQGLEGAPSSVLADGDSVWIGASRALYQWRAGELHVFRAPGAPSPAKATGSDADRSPASDAVIAGLPDHVVPSLFKDAQGRLWYGGGPEGGFGFLKGGVFHLIRAVPIGYVDAIAQDRSGSIWIAHSEAGLMRIAPDLQVTRVGWKWAGTDPLEVHRLAADVGRGGLWLGRRRGGIARVLADRTVESYSIRNGLAGGSVNDIRVARNGEVWVAADGGLSRIANGRVATLRAPSSLPCDGVYGTVAEDDGGLWAYTKCGLAQFAAADLDAWRGAVDRRNSPPILRSRVVADGLPDATIMSSVSPHLTRASDGALWFITMDSAVRFDPRHIPFNPLPPPVHIEGLFADEKPYDTAGRPRLPPLTRYLSIDYTALGLVAPERVRFRYRLEGFDKAWREVVNVRRALYTNLPPRHYRFRVIAANNDGVWNTAGDALDFAIAPAWWQTWWFRIALAVSLAALLVVAWRMRLRAVVREREVERREQQLRLELAHAARLATMGQLVASVSHEVRQPISSVLVSGDAAKRWVARGDVEQVGRALDTILRSAARANEIIDGLRVLARKQPAEQHPFDLVEAIGEVTLLIRGEANKAGVTIDLQLPERLPPARGNRVQVQQVAMNLAINAIEAMSAGGASPRELRIRVEPAQMGRLAVIVADTGPGLNPEAAKRAFESFYTTKPEGMGMGLSICRSIVEAHGGQLTLSPNTPHGAVFRFTVPIDWDAAATPTV